MMTLKEIIGDGVDQSKLNPKKVEQCQDLTNRVNIIRVAYNKAMIVNSGVRTWAHHIEIYKELAAQKRHPFPKGVFDEALVPKASKHLETVLNAAAVDIKDPGQLIKKWLKETPEGRAAADKADVWFEDDDIQRLHIQNKPFGSYKPGGTRWFRP